MSDSIDAAQVVDAQLAAYNARDLDRFLAFFADDPVLRAADGTEVARGLAALSAGYGPWFEGNPALHAEVTGRLVLGDVVVDRERVETAQGLLAALVVYELRDGRIIAMTTLAQGPDPSVP